MSLYLLQLFLRNHRWAVCVIGLCSWDWSTEGRAQDFQPSLEGTPAVAPSTLRPLLTTPAASTMQPATPLPADQPLVASKDSGTIGCLVARDGRVFHGKVQEQGDAYRVDTTSGSIVVPYDEVLVMANTLNLAYSQIRDSRRQPGAAEHVDLGRWCLQNRLYEEASDEARAALQLEPRRQAALDLLQQSEKALSDNPLAHVATAPVVAATDLPPQAEFVRRIQPLLLNKCSNANCHGASSENQFKLQPVATGARPQNLRTSQNLESVLKQINRDHPDQSPLILKSHEVVGPHANVFTGSRSREHSERLMTWVQQITREGPGGTRKAPLLENQPRPLLTFRPRTEAEIAAAPAAPPGIQPANVEMAADELPKPATIERRPKSAPLRSPEVMRLLENQRTDLFDPDEFNRMVHGVDPPSRSR
ncbi:MAG: hypothetical protein DWH91_03490 [Planctomycetota bacterium]|nr:MAG: hypothetical protein DWH91_03490 [Planctomycetota bacterium]